MADMPIITFNDGNSIPQLGFGVWQVGNDEAVPVVGEAIRAGYRAIDTAQGYGNEEGVGKAIAASGLGRDEIFITSKLTNSQHEWPRPPPARPRHCPPATRQIPVEEWHCRH